MALINLPNHTEAAPIQWDTELDIYSQSLEAQEYAYGLINQGENTTLTEKEYCRQSLADEAMYRDTKKVYEDLTNSLKLEETIEYVHSTSHTGCYACKGKTYQVIEIV